MFSAAGRAVSFRNQDRAVNSRKTSSTVALDALFEPIMQAAVAEIGVISPLLEKVAAYHMGWRNADLSRVTGERTNPGKRMRPRLAMLVAAGLGADPALAAPVAASIELL